MALHSGLGNGIIKSNSDWAKVRPTYMVVWDGTTLVISHCVIKDITPWVFSDAMASKGLASISSGISL